MHLGHGADGGPYISASVDFVVDPRTGLTNVGMRRLMLRGRRETGIDLVSPSDLRAIYEASAAAGKPLPVSFVVGSHPIDQVAAMMRLPVDELGLISALRDAPLPVVKCVTNDIRVPADAEWVLEGYLDARGHVEPEGPYGEFLGYYGALKLNPVFHLTAITRRRDALFQTATIGGRRSAAPTPRSFPALRTEVMIWRALETAVREPVAVYATTSSGGMFNLRIALRQRVPGEARNAIAACFGALANVKNVFVVDPDIDIFSDEQMDWALATRFQADRDLIVVDGPAHAAARSFGDAGHAHRRQSGLRPDLAVRHRRPARDARAGAAAVCRRALCVGRGGARARTEIFRGADDGDRQPRRPRCRARARAAACRRHARPRCRRAVCGEGVRPTPSCDLGTNERATKYRDQFSTGRNN